MKTAPKRQVLRHTGTLNPRADRVTDELFSGSDFFDPNDLLQVKYEMLRRVHSDGFTVRRAAQLFGFSRPSFYQTQETFTRGGLGALVPQKRGPRDAHKLSQKIMAFIQRTIAADPAANLVAAVQKEFGSFDAYVWRFVGGKPKVNRPRSHGEVPAETAEAQALSKDLKKRGFRFVGPTIMYAYMQSMGLVDDHIAGCWKRQG